MNCPTCEEPLNYDGMGEGMTLVGFYSPPGHDHDDNCRFRGYVCKNGHYLKVSKRNTCHCGLKGKVECFCHKGPKVEEWP